MAAIHEPKGLDEWVAILSEKPIPVLAHSIAAINELLHQQGWGLSDIADIVCTDPIMRVYLIRECQTVFSKKTAGTMTDVHHCVSLLGEDRVIALIKQFKPMTDDTRQLNEAAYQAAVVQSFHAAEHLLQWNQVRKQSSVEKNYLAAELMGMPVWSLWYFATREMSIIHRLETHEKVARRKAEQAVLGCTAREIVLALAIKWQFPEVILDALDYRHFPSPAFLGKVTRRGYRMREPKIPNKDEHGRIVKTSAFIVSLAHWLAHETAIDWYSRYTRRVLAIVAAYLEIDMHQARTLAQKAALQVSRKYNFFKAAEMPASRLLLPPFPGLRRRVTDAQLPAVVKAMSEGKQQIGSLFHAPKPVQAEPSSQNFMVEAERRLSGQAKLESSKPSVKIPATARPPAAKTKSQEPSIPGFRHLAAQTEYKAYIDKLLHQPAEASVVEMLRKSLDVLAKTTYLARLLLFLPDKSGNLLTSDYQLGCEDHPEMARIKIKLQPSNFFTELLRKPGAVWSRPDQRSEIKSLLPGAFKQAIHTDEFFSLSIFNSKQLIAMIHIDNAGLTNQRMTALEFTLARSIGNACTRHLMRCY